MGLIRITGGRWRGLRLRVPARHTRPSSDRLRQGVFSSLGPVVAGARVLDLFAGTGAYGIEALSRGAASACWVEANRSAFATLIANLRGLAPGGRLPTEWNVLCADALEPARYTHYGPFDLIFADPPYALALEPERIETLIQALAEARALRAGGWMVMPAQPESAKISATNQHADTALRAPRASRQQLPGT